MAMLEVFVGGVLVFFVAIMLWRMRVNAQYVAQERARKEMIKQFFEELRTQFARRNITLEILWTSSSYPCAMTGVGHSGGTIKITHHWGNQYVFVLENVGASMYMPALMQKAVSTLHGQVMGFLMRNLSMTDGRYFGSRQDVFALKEAGLDQVVERMVRFARLYEKSWRVVVESGVNGLIAQNLCLDERVAGLVATTVGQVVADQSDAVH